MDEDEEREQEKKEWKERKEGLLRWKMRVST